MKFIPEGLIFGVGERTAPQHVPNSPGSYDMWKKKSKKPLREALCSSGEETRTQNLRCDTNANSEIFMFSVTE